LMLTGRARIRRKKAVFLRLLLGWERSKRGSCVYE
jgi:hypothetical protein